MKTYLILIILPITMFAQQHKELPKSKVDYNAFADITEEVLAYRQPRLISLETFLEFAKDSNTILLDTRSKSAYDKKHLKGATHLNFSDFTEKKLVKLIPDKKTRILIYCNNNIDGDALNFPTKSLPLALNIPTFINLYGYGYKNVYELESLVPVKDKRLRFKGTAVK
ncbi:rhodanese-like domain-containing protein [Aquimarina litoralis]|uniref:rhodanese-like domain-containing protein n=1 Tax=Aquimarina litoralis TaxID=584605 RepID=UPI001C55EA32|nr:rhodanese-like domain-containing protein [Aquimarina litoralis]MBW1294634.1 rhodanese-like domain-containing protein [Aquimarina litoralis]